MSKNTELLTLSESSRNKWQPLVRIIHQEFLYKASIYKSVGRTEGNHRGQSSNLELMAVELLAPSDSNTNSICGLFTPTPTGHSTILFSYYLPGEETRSHQLGVSPTRLPSTLDASQRSRLLCFPAGSVVKNPPANAGDTGLIPDPGRSRKSWSNSIHVPQLLSLCSRAWEPQLLKPELPEAHVLP